MKVLLTTVAVAMIVYVQGQDECGKVACDLAAAFRGCAEQCGGSYGGPADADAIYAVS